MTPPPTHRSERALVGFLIAVMIATGILLNLIAVAIQETGR